MAQRVHSSSALSMRSRSTLGSDPRTSSLIHPIHVAEYLYRRLLEVGIRGVHGVTGHHNSLLLDYIEPCGLQFVGNSNELNAGYAADGYARIKGIGALVTSYGVGELSAINAMAGSYAEYVPVIHIVGVPSITSQQDGMILHDMLGNGNSSTFSDMARSVSCTVIALNDPLDIPTRIDHAIRECWTQSRPVYVTIPTDIVPRQVEGHRLNTPIDLSTPANDPDKEDYVVEVVSRYLNAAKNPVVLVDACAIRHRAVLEVHNLVEKSGLPLFVSPMGKGAVNEALPNYCGVYAGDASSNEIRERVESADLVLSIGAIKNDFITSAFSYRVSELSTIDIYSTSVRVKYSDYPQIRMAGVLRKLVDRMTTGQLSITQVPGPPVVWPAHKRDSLETITHSWFWKYMARWLQPNDIVITETGDPSIGIWETRFPPNVTAISQVLWGGKGYALAACQGASLAARELSRPSNLREKDVKLGSRTYRTILFTTGEGLQATAQELSTIVRLKLNPIIFVLCDPSRRSSTETIGFPYPGSPAAENPSPVRRDWKYKDLLPNFGAVKTSYQSCTIGTRKQVQALLVDENFCEAKELQLVEVVMDKTDRFVKRDGGSSGSARTGYGS